MTTTREELLAGLCDDAALFPPGNLPLVDAVPAHIEHLASEHRELVGPFIVSAGSVPRRLGPLLVGAEPGSFEVAMTVPPPTQLTAALAVAASVRQLRVVAVEVATPDRDRPPRGGADPGRRSARTDRRPRGIRRAAP